MWVDGGDGIDEALYGGLFSHVSWRRNGWPRMGSMMVWVTE